MSESTESFPRQRARTRGFRLGAPRSFRIATMADGTVRVVFVRSAEGRTASGDLWVVDEREGWRERRVVHAASLGTSGELPAAELARRERLREVTSGITAYSLDDVGRRAAFAVDGVPYTVDLDEGIVRELPHPGPVVDPQVSPDGRLIAFVCAGRVHVVDDDHQRPITPEATQTTTWGLADFIAAEELERHRGMWWLADSTGLLIECVDEAAVETRWIGDPAQPEREPAAHRYPAAGTSNAAVSLHLIDLAGERTELDWDHAQFPYLSSVYVPTHSDPVVAVLSRDQQRQRIMQVRDGAMVTRADRFRSPWMTIMAGVPTVDGTGALIEILDNAGAFRVCRDEVAFSPPELNVEAVLDVTDQGVVAIGAYEPTTRVVVSISFAGDVTVESDASAWTSAIAHGQTRIESTATLTDTSSAVRILSGSVSGSVSGSIAVPIESKAERACLQPRPRLHEVGDRSLSCALLLPKSHQPGMTWPVICSPYGGPHAQRVIRAGGAYLTEQWLADQGFAVVVIDGRGTPGRGPEWEYAVHHDLPTPVLQDQVDGLLALAAIEDALDLSRVGIRGWSFGGYLAALAVLDRPDVFHAAVAGAPVTDWRLYDTAYTERYLGDPNDDDVPYQRTSLLPRASKLTRPLLLIHGLADDNVLAAHTLQLSSALLAAGKAHNVLPLSGVTHMTPQEVVAENLLLTEVEFFRTHLR